MRTTILVIGSLLAALPAAARNKCDPAWSIVASPNVGSQDNVLISVAGASANDVFAVGQYAPESNPDQTNTLALRYDGTSWSVVPSPAASTATSFLAVATTLRGAWAVGYGLPEFFSRSLIASWNGAAFVAMPHPQPGMADLLFGVSATSDTDVWAVGWYRTADTVFHTLVEHYDGASWSIVPSPDPGPLGNQLYAVRAIAPDDVWAVGQKITGAQPDAALVLHWDGRGWETVGVDDLDASATELLGLAGPSGDRLYAVGESQDHVQSSRTFAVRSGSSVWMIQRSGNVGAGENHLVGVAVDPSGVAWAVGHSADAEDKNAVTLIERNDRSSWKVVASPNATSDGNNMLGGIAAVGSDTWAVGTYDGPSAAQTLVLHRCQR